MKRQLSILALVTALLIATAGLAWARSSEQGHYVIHVVDYGEDLFLIADMYGVPVEAIMWHNRLSDPTDIYVGYVLVVPVQPQPGHWPHPEQPHYPPPGPKPTAKPVYVCTKYHTVAAGETLSGIAWEYGKTVWQLVEYNHLHDVNFVYVGQKLCVALALQTPTPPPAKPDQTHTVAQGETLYDIAERYGVGYWDIAFANNLVTVEAIQPGQTLVIPGSGGSPGSYQPAPTVTPTPLPGATETPQPTITATTTVTTATTANTAEAKPAALIESYGSLSGLPLPKADHPVTVVLKGGLLWVGEATTAYADKEAITTLVVQTTADEQHTIRLTSADFETTGKTELDKRSGVFLVVFQNIPAGDYEVMLEDPTTPTRKVKTSLGEGQRAEVYFDREVVSVPQTLASPKGWVLSYWDNPSQPGEQLGGWSNVVVRTPSSGLVVRIAGEGGGYESHCVTGAKGPGVCELSALGANLYNIWIDGTDLTLKTYLDGKAYAEFAFGPQE